jgi:hypothetical protein
MSDPNTVKLLTPACSRERLQEMIHLARELRTGVPGVTPVTLEVLCSICDVDMLQLEATQSLSSENVERLARRINRRDETVRLALRKYLLKDLLDYTSFYAVRSEAYSNMSKTEVHEGYDRKLWIAG